MLFLKSEKEFLNLNLKPNTNLKYQIKCTNCGKIFENQNKYKDLKKRFLKKGWKKFTWCKSCAVKLGRSYRTKEDEEKSLEKRTQTMLQKYGVTNPTYLKDHNRKVKETCLKKYGVENPSQLEEIKKKKEETSLKHFGVKNPQQLKEIKEKTQQTNLQRYGALNASQSDKIKERTKQNNLKKYGLEYPTQSEDFKNHLKNIWSNDLKKEEMSKKTSETWLKKSPEELREIQKKRSKRYQYDNQSFDSKPELAFYIWCRDQGFNIKREPKIFSYFVEKEYHYIPDFEVNGKLYEIKGNQFLAEDGTWRDVWNPNNDKWLEAKHQCALKNNVIILYPKNYKKYLDYVKFKYGRHYLNITWTL